MKTRTPAIRVALQRLRFFLDVLQDLLRRGGGIGAVDLAAAALLRRQLERHDDHALLEDVALRRGRGRRRDFVSMAIFFAAMIPLSDA